MKELKLKIKREYYNVIRELTDRQAGELIKGVCAYAYDGKPFETKDGYLKGLFFYIRRDIDVAKRGFVNGKKSAEVRAERRRKEAMANLAAVIGGVIVAAESAAAGEEEGE